MMVENRAGFAEVDHTADWALKVWAPDLSMLFATAAQGMYWLTETTLQAEPRVSLTIDLTGGDPESLLVAFLSELVFLGESKRLGFDGYVLTFEDEHLRAIIHGAPIAGQKKEIKAVTYHNLSVRRSPEGLTVTIIFDV